MTTIVEPTETAGLESANGLLLGIDTCGAAGSVALARAQAGTIKLLGQAELAGRTYSATLIAAVSNLLKQADARLDLLRAIVIVNGPGSFTGVRVGVSAVKGLVEGRPIGVTPVSRLEVLAAKAGVGAAALDAHRSEVFLRVAGAGAESRELLAGREELAQIQAAPQKVAICDDGAEVLLKAAWPGTELVRVASPTALDAIARCAERVAAGAFSDVALLDGHYLRRSDAEIFGAPGARTKNS